jgi:ribose transport system ATP-binding protein
MKILSGVYSDYGGDVLLDGQRLAFSSPRDAQNMGISIIHQELNMVPELTVAENIFLGREPHNALGFISRRTILRDTRNLLEPLGLRVNPNRRVGTLRVGEQQLTEIAKALSLNTQILILDEPTSARQRLNTSFRSLPISRHTASR